MWLGVKYIRRIAMIGAGIVLAAIAGTSFAWAKSGYCPKPPTPFPRAQVIHIEKCRSLARSSGIESIVFARECSTVKLYINY
jgi:hypothetical protein